MGRTRYAVLAFVAAAALGSAYTAPGYSVVSNVISELAAQNTQGRYIMVAAFIFLGSMVALEGLRPFRPSLVPFAVFGVAFLAAGLFGHNDPHQLDPPRSFAAGL